MIPLKQLLMQRLLPQTNKRVLGLMGIVALIGFADATYLTVHHYVQVPLPCSILHGCETVLTSPWAMVGPIPLSAFGVIFYLLVLALLLAIFTSNGQPVRLMKALSALVTIGALMSVSFLAIQGFIIGAFCQYCVLSAACAFSLFAGVAKVR